jgi:hypothetical protein
MQSKLRVSRSEALPFQEMPIGNFERFKNRAVSPHEPINHDVAPEKL